ncbi:cytochrome c-type biogenesis protein CcmH [Cognatiyoonia sediminum]|uniref:Cytochrome c-type biogenesis protein CcmH n=1 Tax=Cognatiyoonia sediminum TaxID=1508389 RepID=A0A1M5MQX2_9RHOB|nr:c-type cytochrome biogenesis protein CcmI [Cognatiyoonia sediminum]SHG79794.1 cytochrome c-type biogenesis protein CcmH [Cognatiyoonia sediminum]
MIFWVTVLLLTLIVAVFVAAPLLRGSAEDTSSPDVAVYKAQLREIDRDVARGTLDADSAERTRVEVSRRLLVAAKAEQSVATEGPGRSLAIGAAVLLVAVSVGTYWIAGAPGEADQPLAQRLAQAEELRENRPSQDDMVAVAPPPPEVDAPEEYLASVQQLRDIMPTRPDDLKGWELLAFHETELRNYSAAAEAQARVIELSDGGSEEELVRLADLLVAAADGFVSKEAEEVARELLSRDEENVAGRYYIGAMHNQTGRPDIAFRLWRPLVDAGTDTFHVALARNYIENAAARAGIEYSLPEFSGPDLATIQAAENLSDEDRAAMIANMVSGLSDRLATEGGPVTDWARLVRAYGVLGEIETAQTVLREAFEVFGSDPNAVAVLREAASAIGVSK